ncbi:MAG: hypothetical protein JWQ97_410, partial [Phenylobacterium sp.]|nr:hypothetical protein [Phenylobacterium sp.]
MPKPALSSPIAPMNTTAPARLLLRAAFVFGVLLLLLALWLSFTLSMSS